MDYTYEQLNEYPLRILVPSDSVGAIIGKQGSIVKQIKQNTQAKIDVNKNGSGISHERVIVIRGQPDSCIQACREILKIMNTDAKSKNKTNEIVLKVLAHNSFIGRIIGKGGNIINTIKQETETNITVSSINELDSTNTERIISIKGEIEQQMCALENIYQKLCAAFDADQARGWTYPPYALSYYQQQPQQLIQYYPTATTSAPTATAPPALVPTHYSTTQMSNSTTSTSNKYIEPSSNSTTTFYPPIYPNPNPFYMTYPTATGMIPAFYAPAHVNGDFVAQQQFGSQYLTNTPVAIETVHLYVPNAVIGAIIGTKGLFIKSIMKNSNASVKVTQPSTDEDPTKTAERAIIISGTPEAQWKSQYYIFDKISHEGYFGDEEVRLRAEIFFPTTLIGRLIGKGGQNIRQTQQSTGAIIKLPEDSQQTSASEIPVSVFGNFQASQFAQRRIQSIIQISRLSATTASVDEHSNPSGVDSSTVETVKNHFNETSTMTNGSGSSDDAVVASSTLPNTDHSITVVAAAVDEQKSTDQ